MSNLRPVRGMERTVSTDFRPEMTSLAARRLPVMEIEPVSDAVARHKWSDWETWSMERIPEEIQSTCVQNAVLEKAVVVTRVSARATISRSPGEFPRERKGPDPDEIIESGVAKYVVTCELCIEAKPPGCRNLSRKI
jgi:hypothetical protein